MTNYSPRMGSTLALRRSKAPLSLRRVLRSSRWRGRTEKMSELGKFLVVIGLVLAAIGALLWSGLGRGWLGRLPGDINYSRGNFSFHFPIVTCLVVSVILTLLMWLFRKQ